MKTHTIKTHINIFILICIVACTVVEPEAEKPDTVPAPEGMVLIPAGEFEIGSNDAKTYLAEQPISTVYVDAFYMDKTEVTNAQFKAFVLENPSWQKNRIGREFHNGHYLKLWNGNNYPSGKGNHPVIYVSWYAAIAYAKWADKRLPTEAEWEYAARGSLASNKYPNGNTITPQDAHYGENVSDTSAVGRYPANKYGLYDMAGNVQEWCLDEYDRFFYHTFPQDGVARNPLSRANSPSRIIDHFMIVNPNRGRVLRGGAWGDEKFFVRVSNRSYHKPAFSFNTIGFRCVRTVTP